MLRNKNFCIQCLYPSGDASSGNHSAGRCQRDFVCPHPSHSNYPVKKHVLVCEEHKNDTINQDLLKQYVHRFITNPSLPDFSRNLSLTEVPSDYHKISTQCIDRGIYLLQHINIDGQQYLVFFDNGCSDFVVSQEAVKKLGSRCTKESSNTVILGGVGNCQVESNLEHTPSSYQLTMVIKSHFLASVLKELQQRFLSIPWQMLQTTSS